ncbi:MAG: hypothetical protein AAGB12_09370 [Pseudomonadota bacterium]
MYHKSLYKLRYSKGWSLIFALLVVMMTAFLSVLTIRLTSAQWHLSVHYALAERSWRAAQSGIAIYTMRIFPVNSHGEMCYGNQDFTFTAQGLKGCEVEVKCSQISYAKISTYHLTATGRCQKKQGIWIEKRIEKSLSNLQ